MIIASDGVWEFLSNEAIAKIVWPFYLKNSPEQAGNAIETDPGGAGFWNVIQRHLE